MGIAHDLLKIMGNKLIFEKYGLNAQNIYIGSGSLMNQAVVAGSIQFTTSDLPANPIGARGHRFQDHQRYD